MLMVNFIMFLIVLGIVALVQPETLISWVDICHYLKFNGFTFKNFKVAFKKYMLR